MMNGLPARLLSVSVSQFPHGPCGQGCKPPHTHVGRICVGINMYRTHAWAAVNGPVHHRAALSHMQLAGVMLYCPGPGFRVSRGFSPPNPKIPGGGKLKTLKTGFRVCREGGREGLQPQAQPQAASCKHAPTAKRERQTQEETRRKLREEGGITPKGRHSHGRKVHKKACNTSGV
jgi:hypothetical protein